VPEPPLEIEVKDYLGEDETIINPFYMKQLLLYGIKLGQALRGNITDDQLLQESQVRSSSYHTFSIHAETLTARVASDRGTQAHLAGCVSLISAATHRVYFFDPKSFSLISQRITPVCGRTLLIVYVPTELHVADSFELSCCVVCCTLCCLFRSGFILGRNPISLSRSSSFLSFSVLLYGHGSKASFLHWFIY